MSTYPSHSYQMVVLGSKLGLVPRPVLLFTAVSSVSAWFQSSFFTQFIRVLFIYSIVHPLEVYSFIHLSTMTIRTEHFHLPKSSLPCAPLQSTLLLTPDQDNHGLQVHLPQNSL